MSAKVKFDFKPDAFVRNITFKSQAQKKRVLSNSGMLSDIADFVEGIVVSMVKRSTSPGSGFNKFVGLKASYAKIKRAAGKGSKPNLRFEGDMMNSVRVVKKRRGNTLRLEVSDSENDKADGHNDHSGASPLRRRPFIPDADKGETFRPKIREGIVAIVRRAKRADNG